MVFEMWTLNIQCLFSRFWKFDDCSWSGANRQSNGGQYGQPWWTRSITSLRQLYPWQQDMIFFFYYFNEVLIKTHTCYIDWWKIKHFFVILCLDKSKRNNWNRKQQYRFEWYQENESKGYRTKEKQDWARREAISYIFI